MQRLRLTARPDLDLAPAVVAVLVGSDHVERVEWVSWNLADERGVTVLFHVAGDRDEVLAAFSDGSAVVSVEAADAGPGAFYLLATLDPASTPLTTAVFRAVTRDGVVMLPPVATGSGAVELELVGVAGAVGDVVETLPDSVAVDVREVGERGPVHDLSAVPLSRRQRQALAAAVELDYYDTPRRATHEDVAEAISCAPSTASEHLQKAEAKLVRAVVDRW